MSRPDSTMPHSTLWVAPTLLSTVYRFVAALRCEYGAARCSAKWTIVSGFSSLSICTKRSYSFARSKYTKRTSLPEMAFHTSQRVSGGVIGVSESAPSSTSIFRRDRLSMITTSCPLSDRWSAVGQPQKPSPPSTKIFFFLPPSPAAPAVCVPAGCWIAAAAFIATTAGRAASAARAPFCARARPACMSCPHEGGAAGAKGPTKTVSWMPWLVREWVRGCSRVSELQSGSACIFCELDLELGLRVVLAVRTEILLAAPAPSRHLDDHQTSSRRLGAAPPTPSSATRRRRRARRRARLAAGVPRRGAALGGVGGGGGGDPAARVTPAAARRAPRRADALHPRLRLLEPLPRDAALPQGGRRRRRGDDGGRHAGAARRLHGDADPLRPRLPPPAVQAGAAHRRLWLRRPADAAGARRAQFGPRNSSARNSPAQFSAIL